MSTCMLTAPFIGVARHRLSVDGEGVTTLAAFHGCSLRCKYCLNPQSLTGEEKCVRYSPKELYEKVKIDDLYFKATGGGVTFGGGEPLLRMDFIEEFAKLCPSEWRLCAETALCVPEDAVIRAAQVFASFIVDVKDCDPEIYESYTGKSNGTALGNLSRLIALAGADAVTVRVPLIPGYNTEEDRKRSLKLLSEMGIKNTESLKYVIKK